MLFHLDRVYGGRAREATVLVDAVFGTARAVFSEIYAGDSWNEPARQAKFEAMAVVLAFLGEKLNKNNSLKRAVLEEMVDRLEIGLREAGVSDVKVGSQVRAHAAALHGRLVRYEPLIGAEKWAELGAAAAEHGLAGDKGGPLGENVWLDVQKGLAKACKLG